MEDLVYLGDLSNALSHSHVKLNLTFLNELLKKASNSDLPHRNELFAKKISCPINKNKKSATTIYGWMKGDRTVPFAKLVKLVDLSDYTWNKIEGNLIYIKAGIRNGEINPNFPIKIDHKLGSIIGHILGDGSIDKRFHSVFYSNSNQELLKEFSGYMEDIFGIKPRIWVQDVPNYGHTKWLKRVITFKDIPKGHNVGLFYPKICADILYELCGKFAEGGNKIITEKIKTLNMNFKISLVRAFFDDEGSVNSKNYTVRFHQDRKEILEEVIKMLKDCGISSNPIRAYTKGDKLRYYFNITSFNEYSKFYNFIGCTSSKKKREFILLIDKVKKNRE